MGGVPYLEASANNVYLRERGIWKLGTSVIMSVDRVP